MQALQLQAQQVEQAQQQAQQQAQTLRTQGSPYTAQAQQQAQTLGTQGSVAPTDTNRVNGVSVNSTGAPPDWDHN